MKVLRPRSLRASLLVLACSFVYFAAPVFAQQANTRGLTVTERTSDEPATVPQAYSEKHALIIGVNEYLDNDISNLRYAVSDADAISSMLVETYDFPPENVTVLRNEEANRVRILNEMQRLIADPEIDEDSQFLFFFAGHGETIQNKIGYILPHDADPTNLVATGIPMRELGDVARAMKPKHALFLMDACYGGLSAVRATAKTQVMLRNALFSKARQIITAGSADEQVLEADAYQHSAFTYALLDAVGEGTADGNGDGVITALELATKIQQDVPYYADVEGGKQTPQYTKLTPDAGDFLFIRDPSALVNLNAATSGPAVASEQEIAKAFEKKVRITANVDVARVYVDDQEQRQPLTDNAIELSLKPGIYTIGLKKDRYEDATQEIVISPQDSLRTLDFHLESTHTVVHFDIEPEDAIVYMDTDYLGAGTFWEDVPRGRKRIEVSKEGFETNIRNVNVTQDTMRYVVRLEPIIATLNLETLPAGALAIANGTDTLGVTPIRDRVIPYGDHDIRLVKEGYEAQSFALDINETKTVTRTLELRESAEVVARRFVRQKRSRHIKNFFWTSVFAGGAYAGSVYAANERTAIEGTAALNGTAPEDDENYQVLQVAQYAALGLAGILGINALSQLIRTGTVDYDKVLEDEIQRRLREDQAAFNLDLRYTGEGVRLAARVRF